MLHMDCPANPEEEPIEELEEDDLKISDSYFWAHHAKKNNDKKQDVNNNEN